MSSLCAQQHATAFFQRGKHSDLIRLAPVLSEPSWLALADKAISKHLAHLRGEVWQEAYDETMRRLRERAGLQAL